MFDDEGKSSKNPSSTFQVIMSIIYNNNSSHKTYQIMSRGYFFCNWGLVEVKLYRREDLGMEMKKKMMRMMRISKGNLLKSWLICGVVGLVVMLGSVVWLANSSSFNSPMRILVDTDVDTDDIFALLYLLKQPSSLFHLQVNL